MSQDLWNFFGVMMAIVTTGLIGYTGFTLVSALSRRLSRKPLSELEPGEADAIRAQLAEVELLRERMGELENRLEFAERLLAQRGEAGQLPGRVE